MQSPQLLFDYSPWLIIVCAMVGIGYASLLYSKESPWNKLTNRLLFISRSIVVTMLAFFLLGPFLRQILNSTEKPTFIFAFDNSKSLLEISDSLELKSELIKLTSTASAMEEKGFDISFRTIDSENLGRIEELSFEGASTNLNKIFKSVQSDYEGKNLAGVLLVSDGIYNQGLSPTFSPYSFKVHTLGLGDTIPREDLKISNVYYNKIAYQGNKFPLVVEVINEGYVKDDATIRITKAGVEVTRKGVVFNSDRELKRLDFTLEAEDNGIQHYKIELLPKEGESVYSNNYKDAYIDVIEGKEKILLIGLAPHPDIKAIVSSLEKNINYEISVYIPGVSDYKEDKYDLVIFHQAFDRFNRNNKLLRQFLDSETPVWLITGNQTNINAFNQLNGLMKITVARNQKDLVRPAHNRGFSRFKINTEDYQATLVDYPPVVVPFGKTELIEGGEVLLYQQVGSIVTSKPLLAIHENNGKKIAVMVGEGFWQWRTAEYAREEAFATFDEITSKLIQYLSAKEDKRKFRVYPTENEFNTSEDVVFEAELYNDIYERIYGQEIQLNISGEEGFSSDYNFVTSNVNSQFKLNGLNQGVYQYRANTSLNGNVETVSGEFSISELQIESLNLTADHDLLRKLSEQSEGQYFHLSELDKLNEKLIEEEPRGLIFTSESFLPIINLKWPFFLVLLLISAEWFVRKYNGGY